MAEDTQDGASSHPTPFIDLEFSPRYPTKSFYSLEELRQWAQVEYTYWQFVAAPPNAAYAAQGSSAQLNWVNNLWNLVSVMDREVSSNPLADIGHPKNQLRDLARSIFSRDSALLSDDPRAGLIREFWAKDKAIAANILAHFTRQFRMFDDLQFAATLRAVSFDIGITADVIAEKAALAQERSIQQQLSETLKSEIARAREYLAEARSAFLLQASTQDKAALDRLEQANSEHKKVLKEAEEKLGSIEKTYDEKLALQSAVKYWEERAKKATRLAWQFAIAAAAVGIGYFGLLIWKGAGVASQVAENLPAASRGGWTVGIFAALGLVGVWVLRILIRMLLSNIHLSTDAEHRRTLVLTYLALLRETTSAATANERPLVLEQLFRPASDGIVKDDAMPPTPAEWLTRGLTGAGR